MKGQEKDKISYKHQCTPEWSMPLHSTANLTRQMFCDTNISLEHVWKRVGTNKKYFPSVTIYQKLTSANQINCRLVPLVETIGSQYLIKPVKRRAKTTFPCRKTFSDILCSTSNTSSHRTDSIAVTLTSRGASCSSQNTDRFNGCLLMFTS